MKIQNREDFVEEQFYGADGRVLAGTNRQELNSIRTLVQPRFLAVVSENNPAEFEALTSFFGPQFSGRPAPFVNTIQKGKVTGFTLHDAFGVYVVFVSPEDLASILGTEVAS